MKAIRGQLVSGIIMLWLVGVAASFAVSPKSNEDIPPAQTETAVSEALPAEYWITLHDSGVAIELEEYITGVLLAELPGDFHPQAKMAQAVAARTFAVKMGRQICRHGTDRVCCDSSCCQGYLSEEAYLSAGGNIKTLLEAKQAVKNTAGLVISYGGGLIDATYFSCSGGRTEDAAAVWGADVPYLQAVDSPGEEDALYYTETVKFSASAFQNALGISLSGDAETWFGPLKRTEGGGVAELTIGGVKYTGVQLRSQLGLRSANFTVTPQSDGVVITTRGFGHRVGLSQYGADAMAESGVDFIEILKHYYSGIEVVNMEKLGLEIGVK